MLRELYNMCMPRVIHGAAARSAAILILSSHFYAPSGLANDISDWDFRIDRYGNGLPPGSGSTAQGEAIFQRRCESCHGPRGRGASAQELVGGVGGLASEYPDRTVGSYWPYAPPLFDYIRRAMPPEAPLSLNNDEVYALTAYILQLNEVLAQGEDRELDARRLAEIRMPNREGFFSSGGETGKAR